MKRTLTAFIVGKIKDKMCLICTKSTHTVPYASTNARYFKIQISNKKKKILTDFTSLSLECLLRFITKHTVIFYTAIKLMDKYFMANETFYTSASSPILMILCSWQY